MTILGLDLSLTQSGYCFYEREKNTYTVGVIKPKMCGIARLSFVRDELSELLIGNKPDIVFIEGYAFGAKFKSAQIGELGGVIKTYLFKNEIPFLILPILTIKKFTTGKGNADKDLIIKTVKEKYGIETKNDNIADAVSIARMGIIFYRTGKNRRG
jgi:crossover junction endodeoxyribonuclease RuvC